MESHIVTEGHEVDYTDYGIAVRLVKIHAKRARIAVSYSRKASKVRHRKPGKRIDTDAKRGDN